MRNRIIRILFYCYLALVLFLTLSPGKSISSVDKIGIARLLNFQHSDKLVHACMFFGLAFLYQFLIIKRPIYIYFLVPFTISFVIEILQESMPFGRTFDWLDLVANSVGIIISIILVQSIKKARN